MSNLGASHIVTLKIEQRKLTRNSEGHNFSHGGPIQAHHISRRSKLNGSSPEIQNGQNFSHGGPIQAHDISRRS